MAKLSNIKTRPFHAHTHWEQDEPTRMVFLRHGETHWNIKRKIQGWKGTSLNATGLKQAKAAAKRLKAQWTFDAVLSSDLKRAMQTAQICAGLFKIKVEKLELARERNFGTWEGKKLDQVLETYQLGKALRRDPFLSFEPPGGEAMSTFYARCKKMLSYIENAYKGKTVLVVTHGGPMRIACCIAAGIPWKKYYLLGRPGNTAMALVESQGGVRWVEQYNDTAHLERAAHE